VHGAGRRAAARKQAERQARGDAAGAELSVGMVR
jgi:hypothetical protein